MGLSTSAIKTRIVVNAGCNAPGARYLTSPHVRLALSRLLSGLIAWSLFAVIVGAIRHLACLVIAMFGGLRFFHIRGIGAHVFSLRIKMQLTCKMGQQDLDQPRIVKYECNEFVEPRLP
jgi:hypothetical protein